MGLFIELIDGAAGTEALKALMEKAKKEHSFVIHFGILILPPQLQYLGEELWQAANGKEAR